MQAPQAFVYYFSAHHGNAAVWRMWLTMVKVLNLVEDELVLSCLSIEQRNQQRRLILHGQVEQPLQLQSEEHVPCRRKLQSRCQIDHIHGDVCFWMCENCCWEMQL